MALGLFLALYGPRLVPPPLKVRAPRTDERAITVLTHNLRYMYHQPDDLIASLLAQDADLVALEEVAPSAEAQLIAALSPRYPYYACDAWDSDVALFSRYPITAYDWRSLAHKPTGALVTEVLVEGAPWQVIAIHPYSPRPTRILGVPLPVGVSYRDLDTDLAALLGRAAGAGPPVLLAGDFNASEQSLAYRAARARL